MQILHEIQEKLGPAKIEVIMPKVRPKEALFDWTHPDEEKWRHYCPITNKIARAFTRFNLDGFEKYLKANTHQYSVASRRVTMMNLKRFFTLLEIEEGDFHPVGVLCAIYKQGVLDEMKVAPLMSCRYGWARDMDTAMEHYIEHLKMECNKQQPRWLEAHANLNLLRGEVLSDYRKDDTRQRKLGNRAKKRRDAMRIAKGYPSVEMQHQAVEKAMAKLSLIHRHAATTGNLSYRLRVEATTAIVGIIHYNSFAGRSGEWQSMKRAHVQEQRENKENHLVCDHHKTYDTYGEIAKFVPEGSWQAFDLYNSLPGKLTDLFLDAPDPSSRHVSVHSYLKRFGLLHFDTKVINPPPNSNLIRKMYHTRLLHMTRMGECMSFFQKVDAHSAEVAARVYATSTPADDADLGKMLHVQVNQAFVEFPSPERIEALGMSLESVAANGEAADETMKALPLKDEDVQDLVLYLLESQVDPLPDTCGPALRDDECEVPPLCGADPEWTRDEKD